MQSTTSRVHSVNGRVGIIPLGWHNRRCDLFGEIQDVLWLLAEMELSGVCCWGASASLATGPDSGIVDEHSILSPTTPSMATASELWPAARDPECKLGGTGSIVHGSLTVVPDTALGELLSMPPLESTVSSATSMQVPLSEFSGFSHSDCPRPRRRDGVLGDGACKSFSSSVELASISVALAVPSSSHRSSHRRCSAQGGPFSARRVARLSASCRGAAPMTSSWHWISSSNKP